MSKGKLAAQRVMNDCGIDDPTEIPLDLIVLKKKDKTRSNA